jgi:hypothetical protein
VARANAGDNDPIDRDKAERLASLEATFDGVASFVAIDGDEFPLAFVAMTTNLYGVPFVKPLTVHEVEAVVQVKRPGREVTV